MSKNKRNKVGRPSMMTDEVLEKLEEAFLLGCTDTEACLVANICPATLYNYQEKNPEYLERKDQLKSNPIYRARRSVYIGLETNPELALKFLERKKKDEFSTRTENDITSGGDKLQMPTIRIIDERPRDTDTK